jgi:hypothetical protein
MTPEEDRLLTALADLGTEDPDPVRSRAIIARAAHAMVRHRRLATGRFALVAWAYRRIVEPIAAGTLSIGFIAAVVAQAIFVLRHTPAGLLW